MEGLSLADQLGSMAMAWACVALMGLGCVILEVLKSRYNSLIYMSLLVKSIVIVQWSSSCFDDGFCIQPVISSSSNS